MNITPKIFAIAGLVVAGAQVTAPLALEATAHGDLASEVMTVASRSNSVPDTAKIPSRSYTVLDTTITPLHDA
jgi:hypothetical protein